MICQHCGEDLGSIDQRQAYLALERAGDEEIRSWFFCSECCRWTIEHYVDRFVGGADIHALGPFEAAECAEDVRLVLSCPRPSDKRCDCPAHQKFRN